MSFPFVFFRSHLSDSFRVDTSILNQFHNFSSTDLIWRKLIKSTPSHKPKSIYTINIFFVWFIFDSKMIKRNEEKNENENVLLEQKKKRWIQNRELFFLYLCVTQMLFATTESVALTEWWVKKTSMKIQHKRSINRDNKPTNTLFHSLNL